MLKRILVGLDGSENAERCLPWVERYARSAGVEVFIFRVVPTLGSRGGKRSDFVQAGGYAGQVARKLQTLGIPTKALVRRGSAAPTLAKVALDQRCDLLLVATRGGSTVKRWLVGGVTEQLLRLSAVPVLVVRSQVPPSRQAQVGRIVVPVDGSRLGESPIPWVKKLGPFLDARIHFLHVYPSGLRGLSRRKDEELDALRRRMTLLIKELRAEKVAGGFHVERGDAAEEIINHAGPTDLIVMTTRGRGSFKRWILGSVAEKVIHSGRGPVLVYKTEAQGIRGYAP